MTSSSEETLPNGWGDMRLDERIMEGLRMLRWRCPTAVQRATIPQLLKGHDVAIESRTGTGKTAAYTVPILQRLLVERTSRRQLRDAPSTGAELPSSANGSVIALVLVPSVELCRQTHEAVVTIAKYIRPQVIVANLCEHESGNYNPFSVADVVISTPAALAKLIRAQKVTSETLRSLRVLVIDEADVLVSMTSLKIVQSMIPHGTQNILLSATLTEGVAAIKGELLNNPTTIRLTDDNGDGATQDADAQSKGLDGPDSDTVVESRLIVKDKSSCLKQFYLVATDDCHHRTLLYALFRLNLIHGKTLIFVDDEQDTYKLQHFLEQLSVSAVVYDPQLPFNVRYQLLQRFQQGVVSTLICTDGTLESVERMVRSSEKDGEEEEDGEEDDHEEKRRRRKKARKEHGPSGKSESAADATTSLQRGVDFVNVENVILFDGFSYPSALNLNSYIHRIGRTGRAGHPGNSIIFFTVPQAKAVLPTLREYVKKRGEALRPFRKMDRSKAALLQYRVDSAATHVTRSAAHRLRVATVAAELARNKELSTRLNPNDTEALRSIVAKATRFVKRDRGLLQIPSYMHISADQPGDYAKRVNANDKLSKNQMFAKVVNAANCDDPLKKVVDKVNEERRKKRSRPKKA